MRGGSGRTAIPKPREISVGRMLANARRLVYCLERQPQIRWHVLPRHGHRHLSNKILKDLGIKKKN
jgi:hypothetical protein